MSATATAKRRMRLDTTAIVYIALIGVIALGSVLVSVAGRNFFSDGNIRDILTGMSVLGFVAVGQTLVIIGGSLDFDPLCVRPGKAAIRYVPVMCSVIFPLLSQARSFYCLEK